MSVALILFEAQCLWQPSEAIHVRYLRYSRVSIVTWLAKNNGSPRKNCHANHLLYFVYLNDRVNSKESRCSVGTAG